MKKLFITMVFLIPLFSIAQNLTCNYVVPPNFYTDTGYTGLARSINVNDDCIVLNVKFHYVLGTNGENQDNINEDKFLFMIQSANRRFNQFKIFFKYRGYNSFNDDNWVNEIASSGTTVNMRAKFIQEGLYDNSAINVFFMRGANQGNVGFGDVYISSNHPNDLIDTYYVPHEFGHALGLRGPDDSTGGVINTNNLPTCIANAPFSYQQVMSIPNQFGSESENVTRDPLNPHYNAILRGDRVPDTAACFGGYTKNYCKDVNSPNYDPEHFNEDPRVCDNSGDPNMSCYYNNSDLNKYCYTTGNTFYTITDNAGTATTVPLNGATWQNILTTTLTNSVQVGNGETFKIIGNEKHNYMSHSGNNDGYNNFTPGQGIRMRETVLVSYNNVYNQKMNFTSDGSNDVAVLFEPYSSQIIPGEITSITPIGNGTAEVCREALLVNKFQPGFTYTFSPDNGTDITSATVINTPVLSHYTYDFNITIDQLAPTCTNTGIVPINCTRQTFCIIEPFNKGTIISSQDLLSGNYTIEQLDAIKASDPDLFEKLMSQRYYKIEKETTSGAKIEEVFYKP